MYYFKQVVYILDQVKAMEEELLHRIKQQGLNVKPQILVVSFIAPSGQRKFSLEQVCNHVSNATR